ncbi:MAG: DUF4349 domain-containing protein [Defluviitaleaceae bacterium]|nr:DUF4349 domain-containing protein [Defluviitaleaceae bacterium]
MRNIIFAGAFFAAIFFVPTLVQAQQLSREHTITIQVECIEAARAIINELNGHNLDAQVSFHDEARSAFFVRRVDDWAFRHVQEVLRELGEVTREHEHARFLGGDIAAANTQIYVLSRETERLATLMAASRSLNVLIAVNDRMNDVARERDAAIGWRNMLLAQADTAVIHIHLFEERYFEPPAPQTFGQRVSDSFFGSLNATRRTGETLVVFIVRVSVPFAAWAVTASVVALIIVKIVRRRRKGKKNEANQS